MIKYSYVYIITNQGNSILYIGVTSNLIKRIYEHKEKLIDGFSSKYNLNKLVWFEVYEDISEAIKKEKQLKAGSRNKKIELIISKNPKWNDLYKDIV